MSDFGVSKRLNETCGIAKTNTGTPSYMSPEIVSKQGYNAATDVWSLGVTLYELCEFEMPFKFDKLESRNPWQDLNEKIMKGEYEPISQRYSKAIQELVASMLTVNPKERPSVNQLLKHPKIMEEMKNLMKEQVMKDEFAKGVLINDLYFDRYQEFEPHPEG